MLNPARYVFDFLNLDENTSYRNATAATLGFTCLVGATIMGASGKNNAALSLAIFGGICCLPIVKYCLPINFFGNPTANQNQQPPNGTQDHCPHTTTPCFIVRGCSNFNILHAQRI